VTKLDVSQQTTHRWPQFLPDGKHFLYLAANHAQPLNIEQTGIYWSSLDGTDNKFLVHSNASGVYASGYLLYLREDTLMAQRFDAAKGQLKGGPFAAMERVQRDPGTWRAAFDASDNVFGYHQSEEVNRHAVGLV